MTSHQLVNQTSGAIEYFTPVELINAARLCMGGIELDPASCSEANLVVGADRFFTKEDDGLKQSWAAETVWLNWPFGKNENPVWSKMIVSEYTKGNFKHACCICYACTSEKWFRPLMQFPQCFLHGRTNYRLPDGTVKKGNTKGSVVTYFGPTPGMFAHAFNSFGTIKIVYPLP